MLIYGERSSYWWRWRFASLYDLTKTRLQSALALFSSATSLGSAQILRPARYLWHPQTKSGAKLFIILEESLRGGISKGAGGGRTIQTDWIGRSFPTVLHSRILVAQICFKIKGLGKYGDIKIAMNTARKSKMI